MHLVGLNVVLESVSRDGTHGEELDHLDAEIPVLCLYGVREPNIEQIPTTLLWREEGSEVMSKSIGHEVGLKLGNKYLQKSVEEFLRGGPEDLYVDAFGD